VQISYLKESLLHIPQIDSGKISQNASPERKIRQHKPTWYHFRYRATHKLPGRWMQRTGRHKTFFKGQASIARHNNRS